MARGIEMPSGETILHDEDMDEVLASGWLFPDRMVPQFKTPRFKSSRAGMAATVSGLMVMPALQTNAFNPRPNTKLEIPPPDAKGRVPMPWAPTDRKADPENDARMLVQVADRDELNDRVLESERHILADQSALSDLIGREAIEEDLLAIIVRYETDGVTRQLAATTVDGNSRLAIARHEHREWILRYADEILSVVKSARPRKALARLLARMRDGLFPLEHDDQISLRHLQRAVGELVTEYSTDDLIKERFYAVANLFVIPVTMIVAFEPASDDATVLDAADQMMRNVHHPARAAKVWDQASGHAELRDEVVGKLHDDGWLSLGEALYLGPRYEEAALVHGEPDEPDRRAFAAVDLVNGHHEIGKEARALIADAIGTPQAGRIVRAQIITAMLAEQVRTLNAHTRKSFETAMNDVLNTQRYGSITRTPLDSAADPDDLLESANSDAGDGVDLEESEALLELGLKGAIALAAQGHMTRIYAATTEEIPRPYQIVDNMLLDKSGLGRELLAAAIEAWRDGVPVPEYDVTRRRPIKGGAPMRPATLAGLFPNPDTSVSPSETAADKLERIRKILTDKFQPALKELLELPEVRREGAPSDKVQEVLSIVDPARRKLELQMAKYDEFHADPEDVDPDVDDEE